MKQASLFSFFKPPGQSSKKISVQQESVVKDLCGTAKINIGTELKPLQHQICQQEERANTNIEFSPKCHGQKRIFEEESIEMANTTLINNEEKRESSPSSVIVVPELSSYDLVRMENMKRNTEFLRQLGLGDVTAIISASSNERVPKKVKQNSRKDRINATAPIIPVRRSTRNLLKEPVHYNSNTLDDVGDTENEISEIPSTENLNDYQDSSIVKYTMKIFPENENANPSVTESGHTGSDCQGNQYTQRKFWAVASKSWQCDALPAVYSMHTQESYPGLLLTAGKGGRVVIYGTNGDNPSEVLMSYKAHDKWIGSARFIDVNSLNSSSQVESKAIHILTSSDDGLIKIWDASKSKTAEKTIRADQNKPLLLFSGNNIHDKGIYGVDILNENLLSASKDRSVAISKINYSNGIMSLDVISRYYLHSGVVKSVAWQPQVSCRDLNIFASGGQDNNVCIKDTRTDVDTADIMLSNLYSTGGVHTVQWSTEPSQNNYLLTAGFSDTIKVYDIRRPCVSTPLLSLKGHCSTSRINSSTILTPSFISGKKYVATAGYGNTEVSLFCTLSGKCISRGELDYQPISIYSPLENTNTIPRKTYESDFDNRSVYSELFVSCKNNGSVIMLRAIGI